MYWQCSALCWSDLTRSINVTILPRTLILNLTNQNSRDLSLALKKHHNPIFKALVLFLKVQSLVLENLGFHWEIEAIKLNEMLKFLFLFLFRDVPLLSTMVIMSIQHMFVASSLTANCVWTLTLPFTAIVAITSYSNYVRLFGLCHQKPPRH